MVGNLQENVHVLQDNTGTGFPLIAALLPPEDGRHIRRGPALGEYPNLFPEPQPQLSSLWSMLYSSSTAKNALYTLICFGVRGQKTIWSYFFGIC